VNRLLTGLAALTIIVSLAAEMRAVPSADVSFYLYGTNRIVDGARLYVDVVEVNPPMVFVIDMPAVLVARWLHVSDIAAYRVFVVAILTLSLGLSQSSLRLLCGGSGGPSRALVNFLLVFALFAVPGEAFGQREHVMLALAVPYVLFACTWAAGLRPARNAIIIGVLAGVGFALKPYFVLLWGAIELWLLVKRPPGRFFKPESLAVGATIVAYVITVWLVTPEYFRLLQLLGTAYSRYMSVSPLTALAIGEGSAVCLAALLAFAAFKRVGLDDPLREGLAVATASLLVAAALQRKGWWYHFYPSVATALVLLGIVLVRARTVRPALVTRVFTYVSLAAVLVVVGSSLFHLVKVLVDPYAESVTRYPSYRELEALVAQRARGQPVMIWSFNINSGFPLVPSVGAKWGSRFPSMWLVPALYWNDMPKKRTARFRPLRERPEAERFLDSAMVDDLQMNPPTLLIVLAPSRDTSATGFARLDLRSYFAMDPRIADVLKCYRLVRRVGVHEVYQRIASANRLRAPAPSPDVSGDSPKSQQHCQNHENIAGPPLEQQ
jgi:hypothetical protein